MVDTIIAGGALIVSFIALWFTYQHNSRILKLEEAKKMDYLFDESIIRASFNIKANKKYQLWGIEHHLCYTVSIEKYAGGRGYKVYLSTNTTTDKDLATRIRGEDNTYLPTKRQSIQSILNKGFDILD